MKPSKDKQPSVAARPGASRRGPMAGLYLALPMAVLFGWSHAYAACVRAAAGECLPTSCSFGIAQFGRLQSGMSKVDAFRILGCEGQLMRSSNAYGTPYELFRFDSQEPGSGALLDFHNSRLLDKVPIELH